MICIENEYHSFFAIRNQKEYLTMRNSTNRCSTNVFQELDRGFNQLMRGVVANSVGSSDDPRLSLMAFDTHYVVECDLPGVAIENIRLQVEDSVLTISGTRTAAADEDGVKVLFNERPGLEFARRIQLARDVDQSAVDAELENGVLRITIQKRSEVQPRKIEIKRRQTAN
jgi:HSP20 family protein